PHSSNSLLSQLSTLGYSLAYHCKESLSAAVRHTQGPPFLPPLCLVPPSPFANLLPSESRTALNPSLHHRRKKWATAAAHRTQASLFVLSAFSMSPNPVPSYQSQAHNFFLE
ncbi:hypothetical protein S245_032618, partial [Arachis hypogaea]